MLHKKTAIFRLGVLLDIGDVGNLGNVGTEGRPMGLYPSGCGGTLKFGARGIKRLANLVAGHRGGDGHRRSRYTGRRQRGSVQKSSRDNDNR